MATMAPTPGGREVQVTITQDRTGAISVSPDTFRVHKGNNEEVVWVCPTGKYFTIDFGHDSPFYDSQFSKDCACSGLVRRNVLADPYRVYKYTVRIDDTALDPGGVVDQ